MDYGLTPAEVQAVFPSVALPPDTEEIKVTHLRTGRSLLEEGREMQHCLPMRLGRATRGEAAYFSAWVKGTRATIELERIGQTWAVGEVKGIGNSDLTFTEQRAVHDWVLRFLETNEGAGGMKSGHIRSIATIGCSWSVGRGYSIA